MCSKKGGAHGKESRKGSPTSNSDAFAGREARKHLHFAGLLDSVVLQMVEALQNRGRRMVQGAVAPPCREPEQHGTGGRGDRQACATQLVQRRSVSRTTGDSLGAGRPRTQADAFGRATTSRRERSILNGRHKAQETSIRAIILARATSEERKPFGFMGSTVSMWLREDVQPSRYWPRAETAPSRPSGPAGCVWEYRASSSSTTSWCSLEAVAIPEAWDN